MANNEKMYGNWEFGKKPEKGWYSKRPGVAQRNGFDPQKYGGSAPKAPSLFENFVASPSKSTGPAPLPIGILFPGTGSQYVKMLNSVQSMPAVKDFLAKADKILGFNLL